MKGLSVFALVITLLLPACAGQTPAQSKAAVRLANRGFTFLTNVSERFLPPLPPSTRGFAK